MPCIENLGMESLFSGYWKTVGVRGYGKKREEGGESRLALQKKNGQRKKRGRRARTVCFEGNGEIGSWQSLSLKGTWYPGDKKG